MLVQHNKGVSPHPDIPPLTITTPGIRKLLDNINPHKASGPDNISGRILKDLQNFTAPILTIIFQKSQTVAFQMVKYVFCNDMFHNFTADTSERDWSVVCCIVFFTFFVCWCNNKGMSPHPDIPPLTITTPGIRKLLDNINPHKASVSIDY
jgi:hypothetical protein